jgi:hypothetical protein
MSPKKAAKPEVQLSLWPRGLKLESRHRQAGKSGELDEARKIISKKRSKVMKTSIEIRQINLKYILETQFQTIKNRMARAAGVPHMTIARLFFDSDHRRPCSDKLARELEASLGLERGWLDNDHARTDKLGTKFASLNTQQRLAIESVVDAMMASSDDQAV